MSNITGSRSNSEDDLFYEGVNSTETHSWMVEGPYVGLNPFSEDQADYFFGRKKDIRVISNNLEAHRLTILYGPSGVGKSSVLQAGVVSHLNELAEKYDEEITSKVIYFSNWRENPHLDLRQLLIKQLNLDVSADLDLHNIVKVCTAQENFQLYLILDQFEEYFLYHNQEDLAVPENFGYQLAALSNDQDLNINILLSLREDGLSKLDRFKDGIPVLFDNYLRLKKLDRIAATDAIVEPLKHFEEEHGKHVEIDDSLVTAVLDDINAANVAADQGGYLQNTELDEYEAPLLQLIMFTLWQDLNVSSQFVKLQLEDLTALGGAKGLIHEHFNRVMNQINPVQHQSYARMFKILVTPSKSKIAHSLDDLAVEAGVSSTEIKGLLTHLTGDDRILRALPNGKYEIYHDILANAIYEWRSKYEAVELEAERLKEEQQAARNELQGRFLWIFGALGLLAAGLAIFTLFQNSVLKEQTYVLNTTLQDVASKNSELQKTSEELELKKQEADKLLALVTAKRVSEHAVRATETPSKNNGYPDLGVLLAVEADRLLHQEDTSEDGGNVIFNNQVRSFKAIENIRQTLRGHNAGVLSVAFSPDGTRLASGSNDSSIILFDAKTGEQIEQLFGHSASVSSVAFSPDGTRLVSASQDGSIIFWNVETGEQLRQLSGHNSSVWSVTFSPDGTRLASGSDDRSIILWNAETGEQLRQLSGHNSSIWSVAFSPDGTRLASGSDDSIILWNAATGEQIEELLGHNKKVLSVAFSPDGTRLASGSDDRSIILWNAETREQLRQLSGHNARVLSVAFTPDGTRLASVSDDISIILWDVETGEKIEELLGINASVWSVAFSPDGTKLASGGDDGSIILWNAETGEQIEELLGINASVWSVAFSPDGTRLASGSEDKSVILWDTKTGERLRQLSGHNASVLRVAFSLDSTKLASASSDKSIMFWSNFTSYKIEACKIANRNLTLEEWDKYIEENYSYQKSCADLPLPTDIVESVDSILSSINNYSVQLNVADLQEEFLKLYEFRNIFESLAAEENLVVPSEVSSLVSQSANRPITIEDLPGIVKSIATWIESFEDSLRSNNLCWYGSLQGFAEQVSIVCEQAVDLDSSAEFLDSRGVNFALRGHEFYPEAIEDLLPFIAERVGNEKQSRQEWVDCMEQGKYPFTDEIIDYLLSEEQEEYPSTPCN